MLITVHIARAIAHFTILLVILLTTYSDERYLTHKHEPRDGLALISTYSEKGDIASSKRQRCSRCRSNHDITPAENVSYTKEPVFLRKDI